MKKAIAILSLLLATTAWGQTKDKRAELDVEGGVKEISVSPDEKIWLVTTIGKTYYTNSIDSNWHYGQPGLHKEDLFGLDSPTLDRISFFNNDTAIMTGYISASKGGDTQSGLYLTNDGGQSWRIIDFGGDSWIYDACVDKTGRAWIGGSSGEILYSKDFGQHWQKLRSPYDSFTRMSSIFMLNSSEGISGALHNAIYITSDNWKTYKKIATPFDQKKYTNERGFSDDRIEKVRLWKKFIVANQNGHIFYSEAMKINWKPFPLKVFDFEIDNDSKMLYAVTDSLKMYTFTTPTEFQGLTDKRLSSAPIDIKVINHSLYAVSNGNDVYKVNETGLTRAIPYTADQKISEPQIIKQGAKITWGANGNQIYLAEALSYDKDKDLCFDWYREKSLDFKIANFTLLNDSTAILWDGIKDNYIYSLQDHTLKIYFPQVPLNAFLSSPIKTFTINSGSEGCFHNVNNEVFYKRANDSTLVTSSFSVNHYQDKKPTIFKNKIKSHKLAAAFVAINSNPSIIPSLKDFQITDTDKKNYLALVEKRLKNKSESPLSNKKKINRAFYFSVPSMLDTLSSSTITSILNQHEENWSTTNNWFTIQVVNQKGDTLNISRDYYESTMPWNLPWKFEYKGLYFNCYNIEFSRFINSCLPKNFIDKDVFDNSLLIMEIADYLWNKE